MATKLASRAKGGAPLKPPVSSQAMDMWSLGCVLYQLCTRRRLVADLAGWDTEEFQMRSADDAIKVGACHNPTPTHACSCTLEHCDQGLLISLLPAKVTRRQAHMACSNLLETPGTLHMHPNGMQTSVPLVCMPAPQVWYDYKEEKLDGVLERFMLDTDAHQQARELLQQLLKAKPEARLNIHQVANSVFLGKGVATLTSINANITVRRLAALGFAVCGCGCAGARRASPGRWFHVALVRCRASVCMAC
jgi:serine/threonine protein kinase